MDKVHMNWLRLSSAPAFLPPSLISTAAHDSQYSAANSTVRSKSLVHPTVKEPLPFHCRDTFTLCQCQIKFRLMFLHLQPLHSCHSFLIPCIQELPVPHARATPTFRSITLSRVESLIQSLHLLMPAPFNSFQI